MNALLFELEELLGGALPASYRAFLARYDGVSLDERQLYACDTLLERNQCYETAKYAPGFVAVGDDGGGRALLLCLGETGPAVYVVEHGLMCREKMAMVAPRFSDWCERAGVSAKGITT